ncbi:hypothetical protein ACVINX_005483 [Bradyrhizobium diazoefficiens]
MPVAQLLHQRRHVLGAAGRHHDLLGSVLGIVDADAAGRRPQIAVEIVDRKDAQLDRRGGLGRGGQGGERKGENGQAEKMSHGIRLVVAREDFTKVLVAPRNDDRG